MKVIVGLFDGGCAQRSREGQVLGEYFVFWYSLELPTLENKNETPEEEYIRSEGKSAVSFIV